MLIFQDKEPFILRSKEFRIIIVSLVVSLLVTCAKFFAYFTTYSVAILSDSLESIINVVAGGFACFSIYLASKPRDENHPYGHGKVEFFSIGFEGGLISIAGCLILYKAIEYFISPRQLQQLNHGILIIVIAGLVNLLLGIFLIRQGKKIPSITISGNGQHILTDAWSSVGLIVALVLIQYTGWQWLDPLASLLLGALIIAKGYKLLRHSVSGLMDETNLKIVKQIAAILTKERRPQWIDVHNMRVQQFGNNYHIDCHLTLPYYFTLEQVHKEVESMEQLINNNFPNREVECFIHTDPCAPPKSCPYCQVEDCPVRGAPFQKRVEWTPDQLLSNRQHWKNKA